MRCFFTADKEKNFVSAVVYVHNNENEIEDFLQMIRQTLEENFLASEIICVNDASTDDSAKEIKAVDNISKVTISIVNMTHYHGVELSMNANKDLAIGDFVFEFDSAVKDFSAQTIMDVYFRCLKDYDIVNASPKGHRDFSSKFFYSLFKMFNPHSINMDKESFRILSRRSINRGTGMNKVMSYRKAVYAASSFKLDVID